MVLPNSAEMLAECVGKYPYFQAAEVLYLANLKEYEPLKFEEELKRAAFLLPDRRNLCALLNKPAQEPVAIPSASAQVEEVTMEVSGDRDVPPVDLSGSAISFADADILELIADHPIEQNYYAADNLIDKFLISAPSLQRPTTPPLPGEDVDITDISTTSVLEPDDIVTEQMAEIYVKQRFFDRAIEVYNKLSLKYPEKSSYFAAQIEKINRG